MRVLCPAGIDVYSYHSFRRFYATCLGQAGASKERIQSMVRWLSDEAVEIYNLMSIEDQVAHVDAAYKSAPDAITPSVLEQLRSTPMDDDALYRRWCEECHIDLSVDTALESLTLG